MRKTILFALLVLSLSTLAACGANGSVQGSGDGGGGLGHLRIGMPF